MLFWADLNQRANFWRELWAIIFLLLTFTICFVQRERLVPIYTGMRALYNGVNSVEAGITYQRVATNADSGKTATMSSMSTRGKYATTSVDDEDEFGSSVSL